MSQNACPIEKFSNQVNNYNKNEMKFPLGTPGIRLMYRHKKADELPGTVVGKFDLAVVNVVQKDNIPYQWLHLHATKENKENLLLFSGRLILQAL